MTLILATPDVLAADYRCIIDGDSVTTMNKLFIPEDKTFACAFTGKYPNMELLGTKRTLHTIVAVSTLLGRLEHLFKETNYARFHLMNAWREVVEAATVNITSSTRSLGIVITPYHTISLPLYDPAMDGSEDYIHYVSDINNLHIEGSGMRIGRIFLSEGKSVEETYRLTASIDPMVSASHQVFKRSALKRPQGLRMLVNPVRAIADARYDPVVKSSSLSSLYFALGALVGVMFVSKSLYGRFTLKEKDKISKLASEFSTITTAGKSLEEFDAAFAGAVSEVFK